MYKKAIRLVHQTNAIKTTTKTTAAIVTSITTWKKNILKWQERTQLKPQQQQISPKHRIGIAPQQQPPKHQSQSTTIQQCNGSKPFTLIIHLGQDVENLLYYFNKLKYNTYRNEHKILREILTTDKCWKLASNPKYDNQNTFLTK